jgi:dual-specificity kinase
MLRWLRAMFTGRLFAAPGIECKSADMIGTRYSVMEGPFEGGNGNVYICRDLETQETVAIKAFTALPPQHAAGERESRALQRANALDPAGDFFLRHFRTFTYLRHFCLVLEPYGISLFKAQAARDFAPLPIPAIRSVMGRILRSVRLLHDHGMIHTDIKLENILLPPGFDPFADFDRPPVRVKLIDLEGVAFHSGPHKHLATTRYYRSPEILMGIKWGPSCDVWSLGYPLVELALGYSLFDVRNPVSHLFLIQQMIGRFPAWMTEETARAEVRSAFRDGRIDVEAVPPEDRTARVAESPITKILESRPVLCDLLLKMLRVDPGERPSAAEILEHDFFASGEEQ